MNTSETTKILKTLADGVDPYTGKVFSEDSPYQHPQVMRALFTTIRILEDVEDRERRKKPQPSNAGKPWDCTEDEQLSVSFDGGTPIKELVQIHGRTAGAIQSRLVRLGKIKLPNQSP